MSSISNNTSFDSLLEAAKAGEEWAWRVLYQSTAGPIRSYLRVRGANDPDGLTGDVFLAAARGIASFKGNDRGFRSWMFTIAHARLIDERRMRTVRKTDPVENSALDSVDPGPDTEAEAMSRLASEQLATILGSLTPDQRDVVSLRVLSDLTLAQTAEVLGKEIGAIKSLEHRAYRRLRKTLGERVTISDSGSVESLE